MGQTIRVAITYNTVVLADSETLPNPVNAIDKVIAAVHEWDIDDVETFVFELLDYFFIEVFGLRRED